MTKRIIHAALAALLSASPAHAQTIKQSEALAAPAPKDDLVRVRIETSAGAIVVALDRGRAPLSVANFLAYVDGKKFNGETFYRAMPYGDGGLIQGGITSDARKLGKPVAHEPTSMTGLKNVAGALVMAREAPGTAKSDFFILTTDIKAFDASPTDPGFAVFGRVVEGMDVVKAIFAAPRSATKGAGVMKGQMLEPAVKIVRATRLPK
ncbi:MAG: peptidylprolyl isomerase [Pseudomonadota bacterium]|nr:peptidylprolyl isomerase [Pseudomonadota bacterium]